MGDGPREADGMDTALSMARDLYMAASAAVRQGYGSPEERREVEALADIRDYIQNLEMTIRQAKTTVDPEAKVRLINDVDSLRRRVIAECHKHQAYVRKNTALVRRILDWCELKHVPTQQHFATRSSADDVPRSTDGMVTAALTNPLSISDVSSGWVQNQARGSSQKTFDATSLGLTEWETKPKQPNSSLAAKTAAAAAAGAAGAPTGSSSLTINTAGSGNGKGPRSPSRRSPNRRAARAAQQLQQQLLTAGARGTVPDQYSKMAEQVLGAAAAQQQRPPVVAVAGAAMPSEGQQAIFEAVQKKLASGRSAYGSAAAEPAAAAATIGGAGSSFDAEQQQQQNWRVTTEVAQQQQAARPVRQPRAFLHLAGAGDASLTSSVGYGLSANSSAASLAEHSDTVLIGGLRRYTADDEPFEPVVNASSGWESVPHLRQQHPNMRASLRTSADVTRALRSSQSAHITEAAYLSSMASQVHILHDAVAQKPQGPDGLPAVPVVPPILAVRKKQRWWVSLLKLLAGTAGTAALVGAVAFAAGQSLLEGASGSAEPSKQQQGAGAQAAKQQKRVTEQQAAKAQEQKQQQAAGMPRLRYVPVGPAPAASAGCG